LHRRTRSAYKRGSTIVSLSLYLCVLRSAQLKIEAALEEMNREAKEIISLKGTWRRGGVPKKVS
jgi:hypothetical protein